MATIHFPSRCLTLRPPWPQAIAYVGKRLENRGKGVASQLDSHRGLVGLSQSAYTTLAAQSNAIERERELIARGLMRRPFDAAEMLRLAGKLWLVAEVVDVLPPERCAGNPWHVDGQHGIIFGKVYEIVPVACMGGQGAWRPRWCQACKMVVADTHGLMCKRCLSTLAHGPNMPELEVVRECEP